MKKSFNYLLLFAIVALACTTAAQIKTNDLPFPKEFKHKVFGHIINITNIDSIKEEVGYHQKEP